MTSITRKVNSHDFRYFKWLHKYQKNLLISGEFKRIQVTSNISGDFRYFKWLYKYQKNSLISGEFNGFKWLRIFQELLNISRETPVISSDFKTIQIMISSDSRYISRDFIVTSEDFKWLQSLIKWIHMI